ncbi:MAG: hypothetical protein Q7K71_02400 [Candidatus Omnitrophota bacterium]|nr:hypothetical protein [Candidatus Omnitrophota bacterium]
MRRLARISKVFPYLFINFIRCFALVELYQPTYNPRRLFLVRSGPIQRASDDRIQAIEKHVPVEGINTYMDLGSQLGYFLFRICAKRKEMVGYGVEMDGLACHYANALVFLNDLENISFINLKLTASSVKNLPACDMVSFLNVFHHIVHFEGFDAADAVMRELYKKCGRYFIFETGQFDEPGYYWHGSLKFMGEKPEQWIRDYLLTLGYQQVVLVDRFPSHLSDRKRAFFICTK